MRHLAPHAPRYRLSKARDYSSLRDIAALNSVEGRPMLNLLATFAVAFCAAGFVFLAYRVRRRTPPKFMIPLAAGVAMLAYSIWSEYTWASRTIAALPKSVVVIEEFPYQAIWQPWTFLVPRVNRLIAIDRAQLQHNEHLPGYILCDLLLVARFEPARSVAEMVDCTQARRTLVVPSQGFADDGLPKDADWQPLARDSRYFQAVCGNG
jgi:Zn-dependent protease with chaperone function